MPIEPVLSIYKWGLVPILLPALRTILHLAWMKKLFWYNEFKYVEEAPPTPIDALDVALLVNIILALAVAELLLNERISLVILLKILLPAIIFRPIALILPVEVIPATVIVFVLTIPAALPEQVEAVVAVVALPFKLPVKVPAVII